MVSVSHEREDETERRLRVVLGRSTISRLPGAWAFVESPDTSDPGPAVRPDALAIVRDGDVLSQLVPADEHAAERFAVLRINFPAEIDNSGFVGWLAMALKRRLGTGVAVICGSNSRRGGIYDYWAVPEPLAADALQAIDALSDG